MKTGLLFILLFPLWGMAQKYSVISIPQKLKSHADAIIRDEEINIDINKANEVWIIHTKVITILNPAGKYFGAIRINYNKSRPVRSVSGSLYDANGQLIRKFKKSDFEDVSSVQDFSLFEDKREKRLLPSASVYPYTIKYQYEQKYKFSLYLPKWIPVIASGIAVQKSSFKVSTPEDIPLRYYEQQLQKSLIDSSDKNKITYTWTITNMPTLADEPYSLPLFKANVPLVIVSPVRFEYYGMKGSFHDWKEYGKWVYDHLLKGRDGLPESTVNHIHQLIDGLSSPKEIAEKIYTYAKHKNRYISIQIGKGGFEPMIASEVDKVSYGDCKALVNYMMALLKVAGIPSYYTEVYAGDQNISLLPDFASAAQGNHIILCVPFGQDTTWLECTNKYMPFGYLGTFTGNRNVLICTPQGGILTHTLKYPDSVNKQKQTAQFVLDSIGNLQGNMTTLFKGLLYENRLPFEMITHSRKIKKVKAIYSFLQMDILKYHLAFKKQALPMAKENISFTSPRYAATGENSLIIPLNPVNRFQDIPRMVKNRKNKLYIAHGYVMTDSLSYTFPSGYTLSLIPENISLNKPFGSYTTQIKTGNNKLVYIRTLKVHSGYYPAKNYADFITFLSQVSGYDRENFMLKRDNL